MSGSQSEARRQAALVNQRKEMMDEFDRQKDAMLKVRTSHYAHIHFTTHVLSNRKQKNLALVQTAS